MTDTRSRNTLARSKLEDFKTFCMSKGWVDVQLVGEYEIIRMRNPDWKEPMIVHQRVNTGSQHLTTWGNSADMLRRYLRIKRETKS